MAKVSQRIRARTEHRDRGFTLVELIVAMVILATLAAIAIPSYSSYVLKSHRTEAKSALLDLASLEERYFSTANTYSNNPPDLGYTGAAGVPFTVGSGWYNVLVSVTAAVRADRLGSRRNTGYLHHHGDRHRSAGGRHRLRDLHRRLDRPANRHQPQLLAELARLVDPLR